jgi:hypothetical protein
MGKTFVTCIFVDIYKENTDQEHVELNCYASSKVDGMSIKNWLHGANKHHTRYVAYNVCFDAYSLEER